MISCKRYKAFLAIFSLLIIFQLFVGCTYGYKESQVPIMEEEIVELEPVYVSISAVGDVMMHNPQIKAYYQNDNYDFTHNFGKIAPYIRQSHISIANLETTFGGKARGYSGYPMFNSPDELADALVWAGFNVISTVNNHTMDTGIKGLHRTLEVLDSKELSVVGTKSKVEEDSFTIKDVNGIKVGITAYTYETPRFGTFKTLNGIKVPKEAEDLIDSFSYEFFEEDLLKIKDRIDLMRDKGAEIIVFCVHWGQEYQRTPNSYQTQMAKKLSDYGVNVIFGSHPHVLQPIEIIESEESQTKTLVAYSLGNFISNQRFETVNNRYTEDGMILTVEFKKDLNNNEISLNNVMYMPTWVHRYREAGRLRYEVLPVLEFIDSEENNSFNLPKETLWRIKNSKDNTLELVDLDGEYIREQQIIRQAN
ncbi:CapA family protein [Serpentinicella alkaliphila]|uniref:Poly-gamma-glutamate synthesis protein (Capsule biosynthesis protein) n=1 Tax=Serpentinicella alkaliphila TaxID=1734049 RepID=A0A4R2TLS1_9FIRM|nr:CapA family protein [Serpentinicella alkaliphila]QUH24556.1 CapA family protein [Serpentinicella alkaliphila]TCQ04650.1 poly-gamma-glutamate synthesis protein (capsule biosynthesis protein) [Serpentinicella alkaliphila]